MTEKEQHETLAAQCAEEARRLTQTGDQEQALASWQQAVLHYAEAHRLAGEQEGASASLTRQRGEACRRYGEALSKAGRYPEAAVIFQEAADLYGALSGSTDRQAAQDCARQALSSVDALRHRPQDRLYLLTARYERRLQQLAMQSNSWAQQGECSLHIARTFLRRERHEEAFACYQRALTAYQKAGPDTPTSLEQAECHHRLGNLLANVLTDTPDRVPQAIAHYEQALALYDAGDLAGHDAQESRILCAHALRDLKRRAYITE